MRRITIKTFALLLAVIMTSLIATPSFSIASPRHGLNEYDQEMLLAFWQQPAYDGMTNGEAVYDIHLTENGYLDEPAPEYDGGYWTHLLEDYCYNSNGPVTFSFYLYYWLDGWDVSCGDGSDGDPLFEVTPDLYGPLDLHGTNIVSLNAGYHGLTHITDINLDDCPYLYKIQFKDQPAANTLSAKNCTPDIINTTGSTFRSIEFDCHSYSETMRITSAGDGFVSVFYSRPEIGTISRLTAESKGEMFMGWYKGGELISSDPYVEVTEGGEYTARFGGDIDCDGAVTTADALLMMRMCMGLQSFEGVNADANMNGELDAMDALLILRFVMGLN